MARKTEVYTWRVSAAMKASLEEAARTKRQSVAQLLDAIVSDGLRTAAQENEAEISRQHRLHAGAARYLGCMMSGVAQRSTRTRQLVRARLKRRHARVR